MSPSRPPGTAAAIPAASARSAASISRRSAARGVPTVKEMAESPVQPRSVAPKSMLTRSPSSQLVRAGDPVQSGVVDRRADHGRERGVREARLVVEERRRRAVLGQHGPGDLVELDQADPDRCLLAHFGQCCRDHAASGAHRLDLGRRLQLYHGKLCSATPIHCHVLRYHVLHGLSPHVRRAGRPASRQVRPRRG